MFVRKAKVKRAMKEMYYFQNFHFYLMRIFMVKVKNIDGYMRML